MNNNKKIVLIIILIILIILCSLAMKQHENTLETSTASISTNKIEWGIKRNDNHEQPDVGTKNKEILEKNNGICMGSKEKKSIYLTFDQGYEAGYTKQILETLKNNDVKATFFLTAHYINTQEELVKQMIDEGHILGNHIPHTLMYHI